MTKSFAFASILTASLGFTACSGEDVAPTIAGSGTGGGGGNSAGKGGASAAGGAPAGAGGSAGGSSGASTTGGAAGTASPSGGTAGSAGGLTAGSSGSSGAGGAGAGGGGSGNLAGAGAGNMSGGGGDAGGAGGTTGGDGNAGGAGNTGGGGSAGSGGSGGTASSCPTIAELFPESGNLGSLDGRLVTTPCSPTDSDDCSGAGWIYDGTTTACMGGALTAQQDFTVGGTPGAMYEVTLHFYGVVEPKFYGNMVTREAGNNRPTHAANGAMPAPWASANAGVSYPASDYNTYEIHVLDETGQEVRQYFLNSDTTEGHWTYLLNYERTIPVIGGGKVRAKTYDRNCRMIKNCGDRSGGVSYTSCSSATKQTVDISAAMPAVTVQQPGLGQAAAESGQWLLIDVTEVACP